MTISSRLSLGPLFVLVVALGACTRPQTGPAPPQLPPPPVAVDASAAPSAPAPPALPVAPEKPPAEHHRGSAEPSGPTHAGLGKLQVSSGLDKADVDKVLRGNVVALRACYEGAWGAKDGRLDLELTISDRGWVTLGEVKRSTLGGGDPEMCIVKKLQALRFPHAAEGKEAKVAFSLELRGRGP